MNIPTIIQALILKANRHLAQTVTCREKLIKQDNKIQSLNAKIAVLEESRLTAQWEKSKLESQAYASETIYERSLDAARIEYTKGMEGDTASKACAWHTFLASQKFDSKEVTK